MRKFVSGILLITAVLFAGAAAAQEEVIGKNETEKAVSWIFTITHTSGDNYELKAKAKIKPGYHLWALNPGGDGTLIPTSFTVEKETIKWLSDWKESKKPEERTYEFMEGAVRYFTTTVTFSREFSTKEKPYLEGTVDFQTCNENMCFPPENIDFTVDVK